MKAAYIIEGKKLKSTPGKRQTKIKLTYLHYPIENAIFTFNFFSHDYVDLVEELFLNSDVKIIAYAYNAKNKNYLFIVDNVTNLKALKDKIKLSEKTYPTGRAWTKEHYNYNKAQKWEMPSGKRKIAARNVKKKTTRKR